MIAVDRPAVRIASTRRGPLLLMGAGSSLGLLLPMLLRYVYNNPVATAVAAQLVIVGLVAAVAILRRRERDPFSPIALFLVLFPLLYSLPAILVSAQADPFTNRIAPWLAESVPLTVQAAQAALHVEIAFLLGALLTRFDVQAHVRSQLTISPRSGSGRASVRRSNMIIVIGAAAWVLFVLASGGPARIAANLFNRTQFLAGMNYLASGPILVCVGAIIRYLVEGELKPKVTTGLLFVMGLGMLLFTGSKANIAVVALIGLGVVHYRYRAITWRTAGAVAALGVVTLTMYNLYFRDALPRNLPLMVVVEERGGFGTAATRNFTANSFFGHQALAIALSEYPHQQEFRGADSIRALVGAPVPRRFWSAKPPAPSHDFTMAFAPHLVRAGTTIPPTLAGEVYSSWGLWALAPAFLALGYGLAFVHRRRFQSPGHLYAAICLASLLGHLLRGESFGGIVLLSLVLIPGLWALRPLRGV